MQNMSLEKNNLKGYSLHLKRPTFSGGDIKFITFIHIHMGVSKKRGEQPKMDSKNNGNPAYFSNG